MDDLISRKYVAKILTDPAYPYEPGIERAIMELPSVPAVPLDKLCEWLAENALDIHKRRTTPLKQGPKNWETLIRGTMGK